jgi:LysR family glycine cleavage system transcriptional activator
MLVPIRRRLPPLGTLRTFEAVARLGSIARAAEELHVSRPAVSQQVKTLEADLGIALIRRRGNDIVLTEAGKRGARRLSSGFLLIQEAVTRMRIVPRGTRIRLTVEPAFAANWLIARLPRYRALEGAMDVLLDPAKETVDIAKGAADLGIRFGHGGYPGLEAIRLYEDEIVPVCAPKLLRAKSAKPLKQPSDLAHHRLLRMDWRHTMPWPDWAAWLTAAGLDESLADDGVSFSDTSLLLQAAIAGQGVALGQTSLIKDHLKAKRLVAPFAKSLKTGYGYYLVYPRGAGDIPEIAQFREWLLAEVRKG